MSRDTGTRRKEHDAEERQKLQTQVYAGRMYLGYTKLVLTGLGPMHESLSATGKGHEHRSLGFFDTQDDAVDEILEYEEGT